VTGGRRPVAVAAARGVAFWTALSVGGALLLRAMRAPTGEDPPVEGVLLLVAYYAIALFEVPGLVFVTTAAASLVAPGGLRAAFDSLWFALLVAAVNGVCWASIVAIGRASVRRRRAEGAADWESAAAAVAEREGEREPG